MQVFQNICFKHLQTAEKSDLLFEIIYIDLSFHISIYSYLFKVLTSPERWRIALLSQLALTSQLNMPALLWEIEIIYFRKQKRPCLMDLGVFACTNCSPVLLYFICASSAESSFAGFISLLHDTLFNYKTTR